MLINVSFLAVMFGLTSVLETLVSQAHGNGKFKKCGIYLNKAILMNLILLVPVTLLMLNAEKILILAG